MSMSVVDEGRVDTIVARATGPTAAAVAVIRLSGPDAVGLLRALAPGSAGGLKARSATLLRLMSPATGRPLDHALVTVFPGPASYTGEDVVEISCHGGTSVVAGIEGACLELGARRAEPGEFTRRAVANGKLDLLQAEAVADLVEGRNAAQQDAALHQLERGLSRRIARIRQELVGLEALLVQHLDFPDEDEAPVPLERVGSAADEVLSALESLLATAPGGTLLREGALVVLAGRPNAGKSSLFNALAGEERAIVTDEPGTTRDALEVSVSLGGFPFRLVDTAGLREGGGRVERLGIEVAHRYVARADLVLMCIEAGREVEPDELAFLDARGERPLVVVRTKADAGGAAAGAGPGGRSEGLRVSVETGEGIGDLMDLLRDRVYGDVALAREGEAPVVTRQRQAEGLRKARAEVAEFARGIRWGLPPEVASTHLRSAETALEELVGIIPRDEILDVLFREFCIGK